MNRRPVLVLAPLVLSLAAQPARGGDPAPSAGFVRSQDLTPHFERVGERSVLYVEGWPHTVLTVEIPWWNLIYGRYAETLHAYDRLYPAARAMGLGAIKVPVKWSVVEPEKGRFDFSYVDHVKQLAERHGLKLVLGWFGHYASGDGTIYRNLSGEVFAPMDIVEDDRTYPRAVDADGVAHHNAASYDDDAIIERELSAFRAFMEHLRDVDAETRTVLMVQVENEIAVFGSDRRNRKLWRDHSPASNRLFAQHGFDDDLRYSAWSLSSRWIRRLTDVGAEVYPLPFFLNYVGGTIVDGMVGGAPGEDVGPYLENCPNLSFIGLNLYTDRNSTVNDFRSALGRYAVGRNLPSITETNSDAGPVAPRLAFIAVGEFGAPIFAPWALNVSYPTSFEPYVDEDGTLANGARALRETYTALDKALSPISYYAGTDKLKVFMAQLPGRPFSTISDLGGAKLQVSGSGDGQAIVIHPAPGEFVIAGFRCRVSIFDDDYAWPTMRRLRVESGRFEGNVWHAEGVPHDTVNQANRSLGVRLDTPQAVRVYWNDTMEASGP
jgi:hypothetical protein